MVMNSVDGFVRGAEVLLVMLHSLTYQGLGHGRQGGTGEGSPCPLRGFKINLHLNCRTLGVITTLIAAGSGWVAALGALMLWFSGRS